MLSQYLIKKLWPTTETKEAKEVKAVKEVKALKEAKEEKPAAKADNNISYFESGTKRSD